MTTLAVTAINPRDSKHELRRAYVHKDHFGPGKHSISFGGLNTPHHALNDVVWEPVSDQPEDSPDWLRP